MFTAEREAVEMRRSTSKFEAMVLCEITVDCLLWGHCPKPMSSYTLDIVDHETNSCFVAASVVMQAQYQTGVVKKKLSHKAKVSIHWSMFRPTAMVMRSG